MTIVIDLCGQKWPLQSCDSVVLMAQDKSKHLIWAEVDNSETLQAQ